MTTLRQIYKLLIWEVKVELNDKYALGSVILYVIATTVIVYAAIGDGLEPVVFNAFYWVIVFFGAVVAAGRTFLREGGKRLYYFYTLADPLALLASKLIYNLLVIWVIAGLTFGLLSFFAGAAVVVNALPFLLAVLLGGIGLSAILTFVSAVSARAGGNSTLMAVLSFPLVIPLLQLLVTSGLFGVDVGATDVYQPTFLTLAVDLLALAVCILLFPFVWKD